MKIRIKIRPGDNNWPHEYQGKTVTVSVENLTLPDGRQWSTYGDSYVIDEPGAEDKGGVSLLDVIGFKPNRIVIE